MRFILITIFTIFGTGFTFSQETKDPSSETVVERPGNSGIKQADDFKNSVFDLYDKVIDVRQEGEANGWSGKGPTIFKFGIEMAVVGKAAAVLMTEIKSLTPKIKIPKAIANTTKTKQAITQIRGNINFMKSQYSNDELAEFESMAEALTIPENVNSIFGEDRNLSKDPDERISQLQAEINKLQAEIVYIREMQLETGDGSLQLADKTIAESNDLNREREYAQMTPQGGNRLEEGDYSSIIGSKENILETKTVSLTFKRIKRISGSASKAIVLINGEEVVRVKNGESETIAVPVEPMVIELPQKFWQKWNRTLYYPGKESETFIIDLSPLDFHKVLLHEDLYEDH